MGLVVGLLLIGWLWMIVIAFENGQRSWGVVMILIMPSALLYGLLHPGRARLPLMMLLLAIVLMFTLLRETPLA